MGENTNIGQQNATVVYGNPESFKKLINSHGQLCKVKQALACPCVGTNHGSADFNCDLCNGDGYIFTYQRRFMVVDENSPVCDKEITPYWNPVLAVTKVQDVTSEIQGGITELEVASFTSTVITLSTKANNYNKKRVTYSFDGWTYVANDQLTVDAVNGLMYATETEFDAGYQSSNPLQAYADIVKIVKIWNIDTGVEITNYTFSGNTIVTSESIVATKMYAEYYYADLTQVITTDLTNRETNEVWIHDLKSGETRMAFHPFWEVSKGDVIVVAATVLYKNQILNHVKDLDRLFEIEIFSLNNKIVDEDGNTYDIDTDYILQGRYIKWISASKPTVGKAISVRYGYKPAYVIFEDNPQPNTLENKQYPVLVNVKSWSKISKDDVARLIQD